VKRQKAIIFLLICLIVGMIPATMYASPFEVQNGRVYGHRSPDGAISFFAKDSSSRWGFIVNKVFPCDGKMYYFVSIRLEDNKFRKNPLSNVNLTINEKTFTLQPIASVQPLFEEREFQGGYSLPEEAILLMGKAKKIVVTFNFDGTSPETREVEETSMAPLTKLLSMEKECYVREGKVLGEKEDPNKQVFYPQLFIPNAKPAEVQAGIIFETNYEEKKGKYEVDYSEGYTVERTKDQQVIQLESPKPFDDDYDFVTIACRPYKNGVWVTVSLLQKEYNGQYGPSYYPYTKTSSSLSSLLIDTKSVLRTRAEIWSMRLQSVYRNLYGSYDYGFVLEYDKKAKTGSFKVKAVSAKDFPELTDIEPGDLLTAINGTSTALMHSLDFEYWLNDGSGKPLTFTFKTNAGEEKKLTVTPRFRPVAPEAKKDYPKLIEKMPKRFSHFNKEAPLGMGVFIETDMYDPLGIGK